MIFLEGPVKPKKKSLSWQTCLYMVPQHCQISTHKKNRVASASKQNKLKINVKKKEKKKMVVIADASVRQV